MNWHWQCAYCGVWTDDAIPLLIEISKKQRKQAYFCSEECKIKACSFYKYMNRVYPLFLVLIANSMVVIIAGFFYFVLFSVGTLLLGVIMLIFPFATPDTFVEYGVKRTVKLIRILGAIVAAILSSGLFILSRIL